MGFFSESQSARLLDLSVLTENSHERMQKIAAQFAEYMAEQSAAMKALAEQYSGVDLSGMFREGAARLASFGWTVPMDMGLREIMEILEATDADAIDDYFLAFYDGDGSLRGIENSALLRRWRPLLEQCFENYERAQHLICIPALLTVLEGAIAVPEGSMFIGSSKRKELFDAKVKQGGDIVRTVWESLRIFFDSLYQNSHFSGARPTHLNRHWILHGRDEPDWRRADALRLFHTLFTLSSIFDLKRA